VTVRLIWAQARGRVIGASGTLPWHLPEDLAMFRNLTRGSTVVMGRATWDSLPDNVRPLPGRRSIVLTRQPDWAADGAETAHSVQDVLDRVQDCWVIGGAAVYAAFEPHADTAVRTVIDLTVHGDAHAPALGAAWALASRSPAYGWRTSRTGLRYAVTEFTRSD
jgi:dihydrofolate reductase